MIFLFLQLLSILLTLIKAIYIFKRKNVIKSPFCLENTCYMFCNSLFYSGSMCHTIIFSIKNLTIKL